MRMIDTNGRRYYYHSEERRTTTARSGHTYVRSEAEVMRDLAAAMEQHETLGKAITDMRKLLEEPA